MPEGQGGTASDGAGLANNSVVTEGSSSWSWRPHNSPALIDAIFRAYPEIERDIQTTVTRDLERVRDLTHTENQNRDETTNSLDPIVRNAFNQALLCIAPKSCPGVHSKADAISDNTPLPVEDIFNEYKERTVPPILNAQNRSRAYNSTCAQKLADYAFAMASAKAASDQAKHKLEAIKVYGNIEIGKINALAQVFLTATNAYKKYDTGNTVTITENETTTEHETTFTDEDFYEKQSLNGTDAAIELLGFFLGGALLASFINIFRGSEPSRFPGKEGDVKIHDSAST